MEVLEYKKGDYSYLRTWLVSRDIRPWEKASIPKIGYIACDDADFIAVCFLRMVEGKVGMMDGLCTNPQVDGVRRNEAIDLLFTAVLMKAKEIGISKIVSFSKDQNTLERTARFGFKSVPEQMVIINLLEG